MKEYRNLNVSGNSPEINKIITSIETNDFPTVESSNQSNCNDAFTPAPLPKRINGTELTADLRKVGETAIEMLKSGKTQEEAKGYIDSYFKEFRKVYPTFNNEIFIEKPYRILNDYINENKAVSDTFKTSNDKSINKDNKTRQEASMSVTELSETNNKYPCADYEEKIEKLKILAEEKLIDYRKADKAIDLINEQFNNIYFKYNFNDIVNRRILINYINEKANQYGFIY